MSVTCLAPKKFLCRYPLKHGVIIYAIVFLIIAIIAIIVLAVEMASINSCKASIVNSDCLPRMARNLYAFDGTAVINCLIWLIFQLWVLWGIKKGKTSVVLLWAVVSLIWLTQVFTMFIVLVIMSMTELDVFHWALCTAFGIVGFCLCDYGVAVGFGLWLEMKAMKADQ